MLRLTQLTTGLRMILKPDLEQSFNHQFKVCKNQRFTTIPFPNLSIQEPNWLDCVYPIRDQAKCGSCWAFGVTEPFSDRICIASNGTTNVVLAPQDLVSCDWWDRGCN
jgi:Papain family cysteine protease